MAEDAEVINGTEMTKKEVEKARSNVIDKKLKAKKEQEKIYWVRPETTWKKIERATIKAILHAFYKVVFRIEKLKYLGCNRFSNCKQEKNKIYC